MGKKIKNNFDELNSSELKQILKNLKLYKDLSSKLGNRGKKLFFSIIEKKSLYKIEYFENMSEKEALDNAIIAYKKVFLETPNIKDINLISKKSLSGGIKIYKDDNMNDLSFKKVENILI